MRDEDLQPILETVRRLCADFPGEYWRARDRERTYPTQFVQALTQAGLLGVLIPESYGGSGLGLSAAAAILEEIHASGCNAAAVHAQMYTMGTVLRHGGEAQKAQWLPKIATGEVRLQAFGVTEPGAGTDTTAITTQAVRRGDAYVINGQKVWISRAEHSDLMVLLARTTPREETTKKTEGLSVFLLDMREAVGRGLTVKPIRTMFNHATTELFFDDLEIPASCLIGEEGKGFRYILDGMNAERILIAAECVGDGRWFVDKARDYATSRVVFNRPIGQNQGVQFPIARAYAQVRAAKLMTYEAAARYEAGDPAGEEANMAKLLASEASWAAADMCLQTHGGFGFAEEYDVERKFRETRLYQVAPISTNLILAYLAEHVLGLPRSY
ncbi:acyl-CoA dehydrogenase family protein [Phenylobacterium sp.]|uniref:acyl-CoA dehydrogenase family protein n=1 Tax=Phenylobacterium sp. TaxID=1871053 RepID=UPI00261F3566|nr:acyl-CoA dehydrogenase family protein [Phenylobacterium sp.]